MSAIHPFQVGTKVVILKFRNRKRVMIDHAFVEKLHSNGNVILRLLDGRALRRFLPVCNLNTPGGRENPNAWSLHPVSNRDVPIYAKILTPELKAELEEE